MMSFQIVQSLNQPKNYLLTYCWEDHSDLKQPTNFNLKSYLSWGSHYMSLHTEVNPYFWKCLRRSEDSRSICSKTHFHYCSELKQRRKAWWKVSRSLHLLCIDRWDCWLAIAFWETKWQVRVAEDFPEFISQSQWMLIVNRFIMDHLNLLSSSQHPHLTCQSQ